MLCAYLHRIRYDIFSSDSIALKMSRRALHWVFKIGHRRESIDFYKNILGRLEKWGNPHFFLFCFFWLGHYGGGGVKGWKKLKKVPWAIFNYFWRGREGEPKSLSSPETKKNIFVCCFIKKKNIQIFKECRFWDMKNLKKAVRWVY